MTQIGNYFTLNFYNNMLKHYTSPFLLSPVWVTKYSKWHSHFPFQTAVIVVPFLRTSYLEWIGVKLCGNFATDHVLWLAAIEWTMSISVEQEKTSMATKRYYLVRKGPQKCMHCQKWADTEKFLSVKCLRNLYSRLVQPSMGMAIEAKIARYSCMSSSLCHWIWLVSIPKIPILVRIHVSRVLFSVTAGHFRCPMLTIVKTGKFTHFQFLTTSILLYSKFFNFVPPGSCIFFMICDSLRVCKVVQNFVLACLNMS